MRRVAKPGRGATPAAFRALRMTSLPRNASRKNSVNRPRGPREAWPDRICLILASASWAIQLCLHRKPSPYRRSHQFSMQFTPAQKHAATCLLIAILVALALWSLGRVLTPFVVAAVLAYALTPLVDRLDDLGRGRVPRVVAVAVVEMLLILALLGLLLMVVPIMAKEVPLIREQLPFLFDNLNATIAPWLDQLGIRIPLDLASLKGQLVKYLSANFEDTVGSLFSSLKVGGGVALIVAGNAILIAVALFYLLLDWMHLRS